MLRTAFIAGATGLVGARLFTRLLASPDHDRIVAVGRRIPQLPADTDGKDAEKFHFIATDFMTLGQQIAEFKIDDAFCCLGTTMAAAGSRTAFAHVDFEMVVAFARAVHAAGAQRFVAVSALGANPQSRVFYSRVKGCMEAAVEAAEFPCSAVVRPSLLLGERDQRRVGERLAQRVMPFFSPLLCGPLRATRPVSVDVVAAAMLELARRATPGHHVHRLPLKRA